MNPAAADLYRQWLAETNEDAKEMLFVAYLRALNEPEPQQQKKADAA